MALMLVSSDGDRFELSHEAARLSGYLHNTAASTPEVPVHGVFVPVDSATLRPILAWLEQHNKDSQLLTKGSINEAVIERDTISGAFRARVRLGGVKIAAWFDLSRSNPPGLYLDGVANASSVHIDRLLEGGELALTVVFERDVRAQDVRKAFTTREMELRLAGPSMIPMPLPTSKSLTELITPFDLEWLGQFRSDGAMGATAETHGLTVHGLTIAADTLHVPALLSLACAKWAERIRLMTPDQLRVFHGFYTAAEEEALCGEDATAAKTTKRDDKQLLDEHLDKLSRGEWEGGEPQPRMLFAP